MFKTLEAYDNELSKMKTELNETKEYIEKHPEKLGTKGNYETLKFLYDLFNKDKLEFIKEVNNLNLKLNGNLPNNSLSIKEFNKLSNNFNDTTNSGISLLEDNFNSNEEYLVKNISEGSYNITFAFENPTEEDVKRTSPRKRGLMKIFDFINCGDDIEKLKKEAGPNGREALLSYKNFLEVIVKLNADFTLDTELGTVKSGLTLQQCKNICKNLNI